MQDELDLHIQHALNNVSTSNLREWGEFFAAQEREVGSSDFLRTLVDYERVKLAAMVAIGHPGCRFMVGSLKLSRPVWRCFDCSVQTDSLVWFARNRCVIRR